jgi:AcrR family transcriptional regulator
MRDETSSPARERVLMVAEGLFAERGYAAVTLRHVADRLGIRQASLYHHVPDGKEQLFVEVTERGLERHRRGLEGALAAAGPSLRPQLRAAARWLLAQPPVNLSRMVRSDMPAITPAHADRLIRASYLALLTPLERAFVAAEERGEVALPHPILLAGSFLFIVEGIHDAGGGRDVGRPKEALADDMIDVLLDGLRPR